MPDSIREGNLFFSERKKRFFLFAVVRKLEFRLLNF